jgi:lysophospholipase L1-like esterase
MNRHSIFFISVFLTFSCMAQKTEHSRQSKFLALGDSYTIGESVAEDQRWPVLLVKALNEKGRDFSAPKIIATTGWRTDDLKNAILKEDPSKDYDLVSLLIGVNNQYQGKTVDAYAPEFEELLNMAIGFAGRDKSKVFVVSIPDYGFTPFGKEKQEKITKELNDYNRVSKEISAKRGVKYFNITEVSRQGFEDPELVAPDGLHPSGKMYRQWVRIIMANLG